MRTRTYTTEQILAKLAKAARRKPEHMAGFRWVAYHEFAIPTNVFDAEVERQRERAAELTADLRVRLAPYKQRGG